MSNELTFGKWLKMKRLEARLSQGKLARMAGISMNYVSALEGEKPNTKDGKPRQPRPDKVKKLAHSLGVSTDEAMERAGYVSTRQKMLPKEFEEIDFSEFNEDEVQEIVGMIKLKAELKRERIRKQLMAGLKTDDEFVMTEKEEQFLRDIIKRFSQAGA